MKCAGCGIVLADVIGASDPYGVASPACWAMFNEVLVKDYGEYRYPDVHRQIVDAYMAQHPSFATPAGRRSVAAHLVGLYLVFDRHLEGAAIRRAMGNIFPDKRDVAPLEPIPPLGELTVAHVHSTSDLEDHAARAKEWAASVHRAWAPQRARIIELAGAALRR